MVAIDLFFKLVMVLAPNIFEILDPVLVAISECFILLSNIVHLFNTSFSDARFVGEDMFWDMILPERVNQVKFIVIAHVEFLTLLSLQERV